MQHIMGVKIIEHGRNCECYVRQPDGTRTLKVEVHYVIGNKVQQ